MNLNVALSSIKAGLEAFAAVFDQPSAEVFLSNQDAITCLEETLALKDHIDLAIAYAAELADAGRIVGSSRTADYLCQRLHISRKEALQRLELAHQLYAPVDSPNHHKEEREQIRLENRERARRSRITKEKLGIISAELSHLNSTDKPAHDAMFAEAIEEATKNTPEELRAVTRNKVKAHNQRHRDPLAAIRKRRVWVAAEPDADGGLRFGGYLPGHAGALLKTLLAPAIRPQAELSAGGQTRADKRTLEQRRADAFIALLRRASSENTAKHHGAASLVISMTAADLMEEPSEAHGKTYPTNSGIDLGAVDLLALGLAKFDFGVLHDRHGKPLAIGRSQRSATLYQRIALFAEQLVCAAPGCSRPACEADAHHLLSWLHGGRTDLENLTLLCRRHHSDNRDQRDGEKNMGYYDRDPQTGRVGLQRPPGGDSGGQNSFAPNPEQTAPSLPPLEYNTCTAAKAAAGARIRERGWFAAEHIHTKAS